MQEQQQGPSATPALRTASPQALSHLGTQRPHPQAPQPWVPSRGHLGWGRGSRPAFSFLVLVFIFGVLTWSGILFKKLYFRDLI